jgi:hypothetical protein
MPLYRHPHLVRGIVHTRMGAFELNRGLAEVPESIGEALGWQRCPEHADARTQFPSGQQGMPVAPCGPQRERASAPPQGTEIAPSDNVAAPTTSGEAALERVLAAVTAAVAGRRPIAVPDRGIYVAFDEGVVATCVTCQVSWEVSRHNFKHLAWWRCPGGCREQQGVFKRLNLDT